MTATHRRGSPTAAFSFLPRADAAALAALAALVLTFFWPAVIGRAWIPRGGGDLVSFLWPTYAFAARTLRGGHIPLWNPHLYSGAPFAADNQSGLFYPINLLVFFLAPLSSYRTMEWLVFLHFWLAGAAMYAALRMEGASRPAALAGAIAFMFSDVFVTHVGNLNIVAVSAYLPLVFALLRRGLARRSAGWCAGAGLTLGIAALAGHAQMTLILITAMGLCAAWEWLRAAKRQRLRIVGLFALTMLMALAVSAVAVIPALELTQYTARARLDYAEASRYSLPPAGLVGLLSPLVFGRGPAGFWGPWERVETGYVGVLSVLLAGVSVLPPYGFRRGIVAGGDATTYGGRRPDVRGSLGLLFFAGLLIALGQYAPFHYWLYRLVPGFAQLRVPARFILLSDFALAYLAGLGLHRLSTEAFSRGRLLALAGAFACLGTLALPVAYFAVTRAMPDADTPAHRAGLIWGMVLYASVLAFGTLLLDRIAVGRRNRPLESDESRVNPAAGGTESASSRLPPVSTGELIPRRTRLPPALAGKSIPLLAVTGVIAADLFFAGANVEMEVNDPTLGFSLPLAAGFLRSQPGPTRIDVATGRWQPDAAAMLGLDDIGGISNPLALARYDAYYWSLGHRGSPQYDFLGAQFVVADKGSPPADATFVPVYDADPNVDIYLNTNAMPRVNLIYRSRLVEGGDAAFDLVHLPNFDPASEVVIENGPALPEAKADGERHIYYLEYGAQRLVIQARTFATAYLVFAEAWYPGWRATVDGRSVPIYRANYAFRAVYLKAGEHRVEMVFDPLSWKIGAAITALTIVGLAVWARQTARSRTRK